jgi:hypothetical protein
MRMRSTFVTKNDIPIVIMNHGFLTNRGALSKCVKAKGLATDVQTLLSIDKEDHSALKERREPDIKSTAVKSALHSCVHRLGHAIRDLSELSDRMKDAQALHGKTWATFLMSHGTDVASLNTYISSNIVKIDEDIENVGFTEFDDKESSCSDYSDSRTESTESDTEDASGGAEEEEGSEEEEEGSEEEEEEEGEGDPPPPPQKRNEAGRNRDRRRR